LDGVKKSHVFYVQYYAKAGQSNTVIINGVEYSNTGKIIGVDDEIFLEYLKAAETHEGSKNDLSTYENPANVLALGYLGESTGLTAEDYGFGNNLDLNIYASASDADPSGQVNLNISAVSDYRSIPNYANIFGNPATLLMPLSSYTANGFDLNCYAICLNIDDSKADSILESLYEICENEGNIHYESFVEQIKELENQVISIMLLIFAGLGIVFAVGMLNLISTTFIGVEQRKKELGVLSAIGLGRRELKKMLKWEGIWVSAFSSVISIVGGSFLGWLFYLWIESMGGDYIKLSLPAVPIVIFCLIYIFVPYIISSVAVRKLMKSTTVELMGQEI
jgi:ABC-type antimicrobial peptide transport system permease subunit